MALENKHFILSCFIVFIGGLSIISYFANNGYAAYNGGYHSQYNSWSYPSYYGRNNYGYGYGYNTGYLPTFSNYYGAYNSVQSTRVGVNTFLMPSYSYNPVYGYRPNYDSQITVSNALDNVYYQNPSLLAPRGASNHEMYVRGLWPQQFYY